MKYTVKITKSAEAEILTSFRWGVRNWGVDEAKKWATDLRRSIKERGRIFRMAVHWLRIVILTKTMSGI